MGLAMSVMTSVSASMSAGTSLRSIRAPPLRPQRQHSAEVLTFIVMKYNAHKSYSGGICNVPTKNYECMSVFTDVYIFVSLTLFPVLYRSII